MVFPFLGSEFHIAGKEKDIYCLNPGTELYWGTDLEWHWVGYWGCLIPFWSKVEWGFVFNNDELLETWLIDIGSSKIMNTFSEECKN